MRSLFLLLVALMLVSFGSALSYALPFSSTVDFSQSGTNAGRTYLEIGNNSNLFDYTYSHTVTFAPPATSVLSAQLTLSHLGNSNTTSSEIWLLFGGSATSIGTLAKSTDGWVDQVFNLPTSLYDTISGGSWTLALDLQENTNGNDRIYIDKSVLSGDFQPFESPAPPAVPEPGTLVLLGAGFFGLALYSKRRKS